MSGSTRHEGEQPKTAVFHKYMPYGTTLENRLHKLPADRNHEKASRQEVHEIGWPVRCEIEGIGVLLPFGKESV